MFRVFISYSHDSKDHRNRVHELAERLRSNQVQVVIDRDLSGGPPQGWPAWSQAQVKEADRVLIACTEIYTRRYDLYEVPGEGLGAVAEAFTIRQLLYKSGAFNEKFRVILFEEADNDHIPIDLDAYHRFLLYQPGGYAELLAWLTGQQPHGYEDNQEPPTIKWPAADDSYVWPLADRKDEFALFKEMMTGQSAQRILLLRGVSNTGKTVCVAELRAYARHLGIGGTLLDLKGCPLLDDMFETLRLDLGPGILRLAYAASGTARFYQLISDLQKLTIPLLLVFDTYEQASADARKWLESQLFPRLDRAPGVIAIIGGQEIPEQSKHPWHALAKSRTLQPIQRLDDWRELISTQWKGTPLLDAHIEGVIEYTGGDPGETYAILRSLVQPRQRP